MGRNADKRKERRKARVEKVAEEHAVVRAAVAARSAADEHGAVRLQGGFAEALSPADGRTAAALYESLSGALFRLSAAITAGALRGDDGRGLSFIAHEIAAVVEVDTVSLALLVEEQLGDGGRRSSLRLVASQRRLSSDERLLTFHADDELAGEVLRTAKPLRIDDAPRDPRFSRAYGQRSDIGSLLLVPLAFGGRLLGVLAVSRKEVRSFHDADERALTLIARSLAEDLEQSRLLAQALSDPLTGLLGRQALLFWLPREVERSRRYQTPLSLALCRLDGLKDVVERFGAEVADAALRELGGKFAPVTRRSDLVARYGIDSLVLAVPAGRQSTEQAAARLERLLEEQPVTLGDVEIFLELSTAVVELEPGDEDAFALLLRAEGLLSAPSVADREEIEAGEAEEAGDLEEVTAAEEGRRA